MKDGHPVCTYVFKVYVVFCINEHIFLAVFDDLEEKPPGEKLENGLNEMDLIFFKELIETPNNETPDKVRNKNNYIAT